MLRYCAAAMLMAVPVCAGAALKTVITAYDVNRIIKIARDDEIRVVLTQRAGQAWQMQAPQQIALIQPPRWEGLSRQTDGSNPLGQITYRLSAATPGRYQLVFQLRDFHATASMKPSDELRFTVDVIE